MKYKLYRLTFSVPVHFGTGKLETSGIKFLADSLFSAMCIEAQKLYGSGSIERLYRYADDGNLLLSDLMPYWEKDYYLPKPMVKVEKEFSASSTEKKKFKNTDYVKANEYADFIFGTLNSEPSFASEYTFTKLNRSREPEIDSTPYFVGTYKFCENCGLYFILGYENDEQFDFADNIMYSLGYTGIGGKTTSGLGKFMAVPGDLQKDIANLISNADRSKYKITLSTCLPTEDEMDTALKGASYSLQKRSGFVASDNYAATNVKKRDLYTFAAGSAFLNKFNGKVYDVSIKGNHPVYRYAKPIFIGIG